LSSSIKCFGVFVGVLALASVAHSQTYQMVLTGVGTGVSADGVYVSPYQGTIVQGGSINGSTITGGTQVFTGYVICDDFTTDSSLNSPWTATATSAASGSGKFQGDTYKLGSTTYNSSQMYNAASYLATKLVQNLSSLSAQQQIAYSFAIWDIMDGATTDPSGLSGTGSVSGLIQTAFTEVVVDHYVGSSVDVFTASPKNASQEFLVVGGPAISTPEPVAAGVLGVNLVTVLGLLLLRRRRRGAEAAQANQAA
jgi:hypothetical protein